MIGNKYLLKNKKKFRINRHLFRTFGMDVHWIVFVSFLFGNLLISLFIALLFTLFFESPFVKLEKLLIGAMLAPKSEKKPV